MLSENINNDFLIPVYLIFLTELNVADILLAAYYLFF